MALMVALLMRLRCFLLRRGEAGCNGALRAEGKTGATVEGAGRHKKKKTSRGHSEYKSNYQNINKRDVT